MHTEVTNKYQEGVIRISIFLHIYKFVSHVKKKLYSYAEIQREIYYS